MTLNCIKKLWDFSFPKISRNNRKKGENKMANYAYFIENTENDYIDNTEIFKLIRDLDIEEDQVYVDTEESKDELEKLLDIVGYEDKLIVRSIADLSDSATGLLDILSGLQNRGVILESTTETLLSEKNIIRQ